MNLTHWGDFRWNSDPRRGQELGVSLFYYVILFCFTQYQQVMGEVEEMRSHGTFLFSRLFLGCEHARLARTSQHRFGAGGDAVKWTILVFSVFHDVRTCSIGPHLPAPVLVLGEMRSNGTFLFSRQFMPCEHARLARTSQHRFGAGVFLVSAKKGVIIYPGDFFQRKGNVESHSVRGGIMRYSIFPPGYAKV